MRVMFADCLAIVSRRYDTQYGIQFTDIFDKHSGIFVKNLAKFMGQKAAIDIFPHVTLCALDIICGEWLDYVFDWIIIVMTFFTWWSRDLIDKILFDNKTNREYF